MVFLSSRLLLFSGLVAAAATAATASVTTVMDSAGKMRSVPGSAASGIVTVVTSPGSPSALIGDADADGGADALLSVTDQGVLVCRGLTLGAVALEDFCSSCLAVCSTVSEAIVLEGITVGDVEAGLRNTRHARTLTALFRSRATIAATTTAAAEAAPALQTLILTVSGAPNDVEDSRSAVLAEVQALFKAATVGIAGSKGMEDHYDFQVVPVSPSTASEVRVPVLSIDAAPRFV